MATADLSARRVLADKSAVATINRALRLIDVLEEAFCGVSHSIITKPLLYYIRICCEETVQVLFIDIYIQESMKNRGF